LDADRQSGHRRPEAEHAVNVERQHGQGHADREEAEEHGGEQRPEGLEETPGRHVTV